MSADIINLQAVFERRLAEAELRLEIRERHYQELVRLFAMAFARISDDEKNLLNLDLNEKPVA